MESSNFEDFDTLWSRIVDEQLEDNTEKEITRLIHEGQQQADNTSRHRRRRMPIDRSREEGNNRLVSDYFSQNPANTDAQFRRRFRMQRHVFLRIVEALGNHDEYFRMTFDAASRVSLSPLQKCTATIRILAYRSSADSVDDYARIGKSTVVECLERFVKGVYAVFGDVYLRRPNNKDIACLLQMGEASGFPSMLSSIDCMHWEWKHCPVAWKDLYNRGDHGKPTNVLNKSNVFSDVLNEIASLVQYTVNRTPYNMGYYLADCITLHNMAVEDERHTYSDNFDYDHVDNDM